MDQLTALAKALGVPAISPPALSFDDVSVVRGGQADLVGRHVRGARPAASWPSSDPTARARPPLLQVVLGTAAGGLRAPVRVLADGHRARPTTPSATYRRTTWPAPARPSGRATPSCWNSPAAGGVRRASAAERPRRRPRCWQAVEARRISPHRRAVPAVRWDSANASRIAEALVARPRLLILDEPLDRAGPPQPARYRAAARPAEPRRARR